QCKPSEKIIPRAADGDQLGATQGENDANKSDDVAKDRDKPFGSAGWFPPIANQNDVPQLPEHRIPFIEPICGPSDRQCNVWRLVTSLEMSSVIFIAHPRRWIPDGATISRTQASCPLLAHSGLTQSFRRMSAFRSKADSLSCSATRPLMTHNGHFISQHGSATDASSGG